MKSNLETLFASILATMTKAPRPVRQFQFHPTRQWRLDFAWPRHRVAVEIDGGIFTGGGHNRGVYFSKCAEKYNALTMAGWRLLRYTTLDLKTRPMQCAAETAALLASITPADLSEQKNFFV